MRTLLATLAIAAAAFVVAPAGAAATFTVNTTDDANDGNCGGIHCSLREAIVAANASGGLDLVAFAIPGLPPHTIKPLSQLPFVTDPVTIDGTTQPGFSGTPPIELDGTLAGPASIGLVILAGDSTVRGLVINRFGGAGIHIQQGGRNRIEGNYIGTDVTGTLDLGNRFIGVDIFGADDNVVGGAAPAARNVISGNDSSGVELRSGVAEGVPTGNLVQGNFIGTDVTGTAPLGNSSSGVSVGGNGNLIGGSSGSERNVVAGNRSTGIHVAGSGNSVRGNYVGVDVSGTVPLGNLNGVEINNGAGNVVGGNVVSGNRQEGVQLANAGATGNRVEGNLIGTDATGTVGLGNGPGFRGVVIAFGASGNTIGGTTAAARNVISANGIGVLIITGNATGNVVEGNYIGTDISGTASLPNRLGVSVTFAVENVIGGAAAGAGNLISGNTFTAVQLDGNAARNLVQGNLIGTDAAGSAPLPNGDGISIAGNDNLIGGIAAGAGNTIAFNRSTGVFVQSGIGNAIRRNSISSNGQLGIDLSPFAVTPNDPGDADAGANQLQNFPVLTAGGGTLSSAPNTTYVIEFFGNASCDPSGHGEGQTFLGAIQVLTDAAGNASFSTPSAANLTATATDPLNNTSEFSNCTGGGVGPPATLTLSPAADTNPVGTQHCVTATVKDSFGNPVPGIVVRFQVTGANTASGSATTNASGEAVFCYTGTNAGADTIRAYADTDSDNTQDPTEPFGVAMKTWTPGPPATLTLVPPRDVNTVGDEHCVTAFVRDAFGKPVPGATVVFTVEGANTASGTATTNANGEATFCYTGVNVGFDQITAEVPGTGAIETAGKLWEPGKPATLVLTPATDTNTVDDEHCVTATVRDQFGNPTPGIMVRFSVTGSVTTSGSVTTDAAGQAEFCYTGPGLPGADVITAYADTNGDNVNDATEPKDTALKTWVIPASTPGCKVTYGGRITAANGDKATFGGNAKADGLTGQEEYQDHGPAADLNVHSIDVLSVVCSSDGKQASIFGTATINGSASYNYRIDLKDLGEPGSSDTYRIRLSNGYDSGEQVLNQGNVQIH